MRTVRELHLAGKLKTMPKMLADAIGRKSIKEQILALLDTSSARTWRADVRRIRELVATLPG
jgi:hypothetical protein